jgi:hypothetical protein
VPNIHTQVDGSFVSIPNVHSTNSFPLAQAPYSTPMDETSTILDNVQIAPILSVVNFPQWNTGGLDGGGVVYG